MNLSSSSIPENHGLYKQESLGKNYLWLSNAFRSVGLSCKSLKLGPGDTLRSHSADEFIYLNEIEEGIDLYIKILSDF
jgi:acetylornithine deacetylase